MKFLRKMIQATTTILVVFWVLCRTVYAADLLFIDRSSGGLTASWHQLEIASRFYGLNFSTLLLDGTDKNSRSAVAYIGKNRFQAIIVAANAMENLNTSQILNAIRKKNGPVPIMITGVTPENSKGFLKKWSDRTIECCNIGNAVSNGYYRFSNLRDITREVSGQDIPFHLEHAVNHGFLIEEGGTVEPIIVVVDNKKENITPVFVKTVHEEHELFIQAEHYESKFLQKSNSDSISDHFTKLAPLLIFLRYSFGNKCWHSPGNYANLTVDDPWLTEPYGHLSFKGLLNEMNKANFHTTIAFIPWNFDRNKPDVVELFRRNPDKYSIGIHGNNHDHREFYKYETSLDDPWQAKPLSIHEANIKQALARMMEFKRITKLSFDPIMVFPHNIGPEKTLELLKKYNFLATMNRGDIPLGSSEEKDPLNHLRPFSLAFGNFVSVNRYSPKISKADIAVHLFLGNPIIFMGHHDLFVRGIDAFNRVSDLINSIDPHVDWCSLGRIARHLYLQRVRNDGNYDILSFSRSIEIRNANRRSVTYFVKKEESFSIPIKRVLVNGRDHRYQRDGNYLSIQIPILSGESKVIEIEYQNEFNISSIDISKNNLRVGLLRKLSDFRDMTISGSPVGRIFIYYYYNTALYKIGLFRIAIVLVGLITSIVCVRLYILKERRKRSLVMNSIGRLKC